MIPPTVPEPCVESPCVRDCCLDDDAVCVGCHRSVEEIKEWGLVDDARRRVILENAARRKQAGRLASSER